MRKNMEHNRKCLSLQHQPGPSDKPRKELSVLDSFPKRLVYYLMNRSRVSVSVFPHCSIARKLLPLPPCIKKCTIMDAKKDYSHVISGYRNELRLNGKATLSAYCRSVGVSISAVHHWMENYGITTKKIKAEMAELAGCDSPFVPLSSEMPVPVRSSSRIELTFPNGVLLSADQYPPQDLLVLLNGYRGGRV